jgi:FtsH-binding integral membrane protein
MRKLKRKYLVIALAVLLIQLITQYGYNFYYSLGQAPESLPFTVQEFHSAITTGLLIIKLIVAIMIFADLKQENSTRWLVSLITLLSFIMGICLFFIFSFQTEKKNDVNET